MKYAYADRMKVMKSLQTNLINAINDLAIYYKNKQKIKAGAIFLQSSKIGMRKYKIIKMNKKESEYSGESDPRPEQSPDTQS